MAEETRLDELQTYLRSQQEAGEWDSSGVFSLAPERAAERFRGFQQAEPAFWLLRLAQALHRSEARQVSFKLQKSRVRVEAQGVAGLSGEAVYQALRGGRLGPEMEHRVSAFMALLTLNSRSLM